MWPRAAVLSGTWSISSADAIATHMHVQQCWQHVPVFPLPTESLMSLIRAETATFLLKRLGVGVRPEVAQVLDIICLSHALQELLCALAWLPLLCNRSNTHD